MKKSLSHEEVAERFIAAKAINFDAMGKFVAELGPALVINDQGWHGINFGRFNILACMLQASDVARVVGNLRSAASTAAALEGAAEGSLPR
jgi:hypothetical protein